MTYAKSSMACAGASRRALLPQDLPPWPVVYEQTQRWIRAGVFEIMNHDVRRILRLWEGRDEDPTTAIIASVQSNMN